jgi:hypothetical protein
MGNEHRPSNIRKYDPGNIKKNTSIMGMKDGGEQSAGICRGKEHRNEHKNLCNSRIETDSVFEGKKMYKMW